MLAGHGAKLSTSREDDVRRRRARRPSGGARRRGRAGSGWRRRVGTGAAAETACGGETAHDAGRAGVDDDDGAAETSSMYGRAGLG